MQPGRLDRLANARSAPERGDLKPDPVVVMSAVLINAPFAKPEILTDREMARRKSPEPR
jgi:hypothetical protein